MAATDSFTPVPRRFAMRLPLWIGLATVVLSLAAVFAGDPAEEDSDEDARLPDQEVHLVHPAVYGLVFGDVSDAAAARKKLDALLNKKIAIVDRLCRLTDSQKEKLELAGRGDNKRLLDRVEEIGAQAQLVRNGRDKVNELQKKARSLRRSQSGMFNGDSMFVKIMENLLTAEQLTRYEPLRVVIRAGGIIETRQRRSVEGLALHLYEAAIADEDFAHLMELPNLQDVWLGGRQVTGDWLAHLKDLPSLYLLSLLQTSVTDAGLVHLKGLTGLQDLSLTRARVSGAGLAHLKGLTKLEYLALNDTQVNDAGLAHLSGLTSLRGLALDGTPVTDQGLAHLKSLSRLQQLSLTDTHVTNAGVAELKRALPGLKVKR